MNPKKVILFEPWNLGDAVIAFGTAVQDPERIALACNSRWHSILRAAAGAMATPRLLAVNLGYVTRNKRKLAPPVFPDGVLENAEIVSIRGDIRDYRSARIVFPGARIRMTGWVPFVAKRLPPVDYGFRRGWFPTWNRYRAWAELAGVEWGRIEAFYRRRRRADAPSILVHVGSQWRSKQYPHAAELVRRLRALCEVKVVAGPGDLLPKGLNEEEVSRLVDGELVDALIASTHVIANDSGPMHLAAFLGCQTMLIANRGGIREWMAPGVILMEPSGSPRGYGTPHLSDEVLEGWPCVDEVIPRLDLEYETRAKSCEASRIALA